MLNSKLTKIIGGSLAGLTACVAAIIIFTGATEETQENVVEAVRTTRDTTAPIIRVHDNRPEKEVKHAPPRVQKNPVSHHSSGGRGTHHHNHAGRRPSKEKFRPAG